MAIMSEPPEWGDANQEAPPVAERTWEPGDKPPAQWLNWLHRRTYESLTELEAAAESDQQALQTHQTANPADHPDGSVTDAKIGDRTVNDTQLPTADTGPLTSLFSWLGTMIKLITGEATWRATPDTNLATVNTTLTDLADAPRYAEGTYIGNGDAINGCDVNIGFQPSYVKIYGPSGNGVLAETHQGMSPETLTIVGNVGNPGTVYLNSNLSSFGTITIQVDGFNAKGELLTGNGIAYRYIVFGSR